MTPTQSLPFAWRPVRVPASLTVPRPCRTPDCGTLPTRPLSLAAMPPRVLPSADQSPGRQVATDEAGTAATSDRVTAASHRDEAAPDWGQLTAATAGRHGVALRSRESVQALFDLSPQETTALVEAGTFLEVPLGAGLTRYAIADTVPAALGGRRAS